MSDVHARVRPQEAPHDTRIGREPTVAVAARSPARRARNSTTVPTIDGAPMGVASRAHRAVPSDATPAAWVRESDGSSDNARIRPADAANALLDESQRAARPVSRIQRTTVIRRDDVAVERQAPKREDHEDTLEGMVADVGERVDEARAKIVAYLSKGLSVGGTNVFRSNEVRDFRQRMKTAARDQANQDIDTAVSPGSAADQQLGEATKYYTTIGAKDAAYGMAKKSVDTGLADEAEHWMTTNWDRAQIVAVVKEAAKLVAWRELRMDPTSEKVRKRARSTAKEAAKDRTKREAERIHIRAEVWKNAFIKPKTGADKATAPGEVGRLETQMKQQAQTDDVGGRALAKTIEANTTDEGLSIVGKLLDNVVPMAGDQVALSIELKIPIPESPAYVLLRLEGKAARGITGAMTSGIPQLGDPRHLEVTARFSVGAGADFFGLKGDLSVNFFVRGGADGTGAAMKALSYGAYRSACAINDAFGNWWGGGKGTAHTARERAEAWAAMVEEQIFGDDENDLHAYTDMGAGLAATGAVKVPEMFEAGLALSGEGFRRYDKTALEASLGTDLGKPALNDAVAKQRRRAAAGRTVGSVAVSGYAKVSILDQGVAFSGSFSGEHAPSSDTYLRDNWGVEVTATLSFSAGSMNAIEKIAVGIVAGSMSVVQNIGAVIAKDNAAPGVDLAADAVYIQNAAFENQLTDALAKVYEVDGSKFDAGVGASQDDVASAAGLATEGGLTVAVLFGKADGKWVLRFELRQSKKLTVNISAGNVGISVAVERSKRLAAVGYEGGKVDAEGLGFRARGPHHH